MCSDNRRGRIPQLPPVGKCVFAACRAGVSKRRGGHLAFAAAWVFNSLPHVKIDGRRVALSVSLAIPLSVLAW